MVFTIKNEDGTFTKSDEKIRNYIEHYTDEFLFLTICQLAQRLEISEATISRFVRHTGYQDFKELKYAVMRQKSRQGAAGKAAGTLMKRQGFSMEDWMTYQKECMDQTLAGWNSGELDRAIEEIRKAKRILIHAKNASAALGQLLFFRLRRLGFDISLIPSGGTEVLEGIVHAGPEDLVILFGFSRVSAEGNLVLEYAKTAGYRTLLFTSRSDRLPDAGGDINLYVFRGPEEEFHSAAAAAAVVDGFVMALTEKMQPVSSQKLIRLQTMKKRWKSMWGTESPDHQEIPGTTVPSDGKTGKDEKG